MCVLRFTSLGAHICVEAPLFCVCMCVVRARRRLFLCSFVFGSHAELRNFGCRKYVNFALHVVVVSGRTRIISSFLHTLHAAVRETGRAGLCVSTCESAGGAPKTGVAPLVAGWRPAGTSGWHQTQNLLFVVNTKFIVCRTSTRTTIHYSSTVAADAGSCAFGARLLLACGPQAWTNQRGDGDRRRHVVGPGHRGRRRAGRSGHRDSGRRYVTCAA